jgi:antimicrobial peptide system SdpB family protein
MKEAVIFTSNYGMARSFIALSNIFTFALTDPHSYFSELTFKVGQSSDMIIPNYFLLFGHENLYLSTGLAIGILCWVITGYLPQITGILHAWIIYSFFTVSLIIEGGDQISQIITILLVPITLFDKRISHWHKKDSLKYTRPKWIEYLCYSTIVIIQLQMAILYLFAASDKLKVTEWTDGTAFYYWFNHRPFGASEPVHWIFDPLINNHYILPLITWGVITLEILLFAAFFMNQRNKLVLFCLAVIFHFMIVVVHGLASFFLAMVGGLIIYLLPSEGLKGFSFKNLKHYFTATKDALSYESTKIS